MMPIARSANTVPLPGTGSDPLSFFSTKKVSPSSKRPLGAPAARRAVPYEPSHEV